MLFFSLDDSCPSQGLLQGPLMPCSAPTNGADVVAKRLQKIARAQSIHLSPSPSEQGLAGMAVSPRRAGRAERAGSVRLRDAIVWGYMMQRPDARTKVGPSYWLHALSPDMHSGVRAEARALLQWPHDAYHKRLDQLPR